MVGNRIGGLKARNTNLARDPDHYSKIGRIGGKNGHTGGFAANPELARIAGRKGGQVSRRGPSKKETKTDQRQRMEALDEVVETDFQGVALNAD